MSICFLRYENFFNDAAWSAQFSKAFYLLWCLCEGRIELIVVDTAFDNIWHSNLYRFGSYIEFAEELCEYVTSAKQRHLLEVWLCDAIEVDDSAQMEIGRLRQLDLLQTLQSSLPDIVLENDDNPLIRYGLFRWILLRTVD